MSRKEKLWDRAQRYARPNGEHGMATLECVADGFENGYRAAMRDARRAIFTPGANDSDRSENARQFLRPIR